jgi:hypothetical protein
MARKRPRRSECGGEQRFVSVAAADRDKEGFHAGHLYGVIQSSPANDHLDADQRRGRCRQISHLLLLQTQYQV